MSNKKLLFFFLFSFIFLFLISFSSALSLTQLQTGTLTESRGTAYLGFDDTGTKLFAIDSNHGAKPNFVTEYRTNTPYDISSLYVFNSTINLTQAIGSVYPKNINFSPVYDYGVTAGYITRDGNHLYIVYSANYQDDSDSAVYHVRNHAIIHFTMDNFNLSSLNYSDEYDLTGGVGSYNPGVTGTTYTIPNLRGIYVSDTGNYLTISGAWYSYVTPADTQYPRFWTFNMSHNPYNIGTATNLTGNGYVYNHPFAINRSGTPLVTSSYYNLWVSPDNSIASFIERSTHDSSYNTYIAQRSYQNGSLQTLQSTNREGQTLVSTFSNVYLFNQISGTIYKYQINNLTTIVSEAQNLSEGQQIFIDGLIEPIINTFPDSSLLTFKQKMGIVFLVMLLTAVIILFASSSFSEGVHSVVLYILAGLLIVEFIFFIAIGYIPLGLLITLVIMGLALSYLRLRGSSGG